MTITITWWMVVLAFFIFPIVIAPFLDDGGQYGGNLMGTLVIIVSWAIALGLVVGKLVF